MEKLEGITGEFYDKEEICKLNSVLMDPGTEAVFKMGFSKGFWRGVSVGGSLVLFMAMLVGGLGTIVASFLYLMLS